MSKKQFRDKVIIKQRMMFIYIILFVFFFVLVGYLVKIMVIKAPQYKELAIKQWTSTVKIDAKRGGIYDRYGNALALSGNVYRVDLDLNTLRDSITKKKLNVKDICDKIATVVDVKTEDINKQIYKKDSNGNYYGSYIVKRRVEEDVAQKVKQLKISGIIVSPDTKRYYPNNDFLSQVLGHTNSDGKGLTGVELEYDKELSGIPGKIVSERDRDQNQLPYTISQYYKPVNGKDLVLTIDQRIQHFAEKAAQQAKIDNKAKAVSIIVMNPKTGEILAMANNPGYDPNDPWTTGLTSDELQKEWRNRAVSDAFEPGSIFKPVTAIAAMEEGLVKESDTFNCTGSFKIGTSIIHCWKRTGHGLENFVDILKNSCNVGFATLGERLGAEKLNKYIKLFGLGKKTGVDLPGETNGITKPTEKISTVDLATIAFGQANTVSCIQYLTAFNAIANGGTLITPHAMKEIVHYDDNNVRIIDEQYNDYNKRKILDENKVSELRGYLEKVVSEGGGSKAFIEGYHIAGKTGTAQKPRTDGKGYAEGKYIASFVGMAPANDPQITIMISIDEPDPSNYYAGQIAAPVAKQLFNDIFNYIPFTPDASAESIAKSMLKDVMIPEVRGLKKEDAIKILKSHNLDYTIDTAGEYVIDVSPKPGYLVKEGSKISLYTGSSSNYNRVVVVPDLKGYSKEKAIELLNSIGLKCSFSGTGMVSEQDIAPGEEARAGTTVNLTLEVIGD